MDKSDEYIQIYDEQGSELLGSVIKSSRFGLAKKYNLRIEEENYELLQGIIFRRHWKITPDTDIRFKWRMLGKGVRISSEDEMYLASDVERGKLTLINEQGRTAFVIDAMALKSEEMIILENYDRLKRDTVLTAAIVIIERYQLW